MSGPPQMPESEANAPLLGRTSPRLKATTLSGSALTLPGNDSVVVLEFFAAYCQPCQPRLREAEKLHQELRDVLLVGVSLDEDASRAWSQARLHSLTFPIVHDASHRLAGAFHVSTLPAAVVLAHGRIVWVGGAAQSAQALRQAAIAARAQRPPSHPR